MMDDVLSNIGCISVIAFSLATKILTNTITQPGVKILNYLQEKSELFSDYNKDLLTAENYQEIELSVLVALEWDVYTKTPFCYLRDLNLLGLCQAEYYSKQDGNELWSAGTNSNYATNFFDFSEGLLLAGIVTGTLKLDPN